MSLIQLSEKQFKNSAKRLKDIINNNSNISYNQALQHLSQALFQKPFEEIKSTMFNEDCSESAYDPVLILHYGSESILSYQGNFISQLNVGTPSEISLDLLISTAKSTADSNNTEIKQEFLPEILGEEWEVYDVINFAEKLGLFKYEKSILDCFESARVVSLNRNPTYTLDGDWEDQLSDMIDSGENPFMHYIWSAEWVENDYTKREFYFSLANILDALPQNNDFTEWKIKDDSGQTFLVSFVF